jgi:hypothetical protein
LEPDKSEKWHYQKRERENKEREEIEKDWKRQKDWMKRDGAERKRDDGRKIFGERVECKRERWSERMRELITRERDSERYEERERQGEEREIERWEKRGMQNIEEERNGESCEERRMQRKEEQRKRFKEGMSEKYKREIKIDA